MRSILLTGGNGYIGTHTCVSFLKKNYKIIVLDSNVNSSPISLKRVKEIFKLRKNSQENIIFEKGDIRNEIFLRNVFINAIKRNSPIKAVVHFAGLKSVKDSVIDPLSYWDSNLFGALCLLKVMNKYKCKTIVFSSSAAIYGKNIKNPIEEISLIKPISPYGDTKVAVEKILENLFLSDTKHEWRIANLRYFNPIGAHHTGLIGENPYDVPSNIFPYICGVAIGKYKKLNIFGNDWPTKDGTGVRDYIHVMDLADSHLSAMEFLLNNEPQIINLNIGTGIGTSVLELVKIFEKVNNCIIPFDFYDRRLGDVAQLIANNKNAIYKLNWKPKKSLEDMCRDGWKWKKLNPNGY